MLNILDLFSGIGGISHALREFAKPVAFVDICPHSRRFLSAKYPDIPVHEDVKNLDATATLFSRIDILSAGFPCTGFSNAGKKAGFDNVPSSLFFEVVRIAKECNPNMIFLENSHVLSKPKNISVIQKSLGDLGYDVQFHVSRARDVGALHGRFRCFVLAVKKLVDIDFSNHEYFSWDSEGPPKQLETNDKKNILHCKLLGNSVVPEQVYAAFVTLYSKFTNVDTKYASKPRKPLDVELFVNKSRPNPKLKQSNILKHNVITPYYSTILRSSPTCGCKTLTVRCAKMLPCQLQFEEGGNVDFYMNAAWVAFFMGFPPDYFS